MILRRLTKHIKEQNWFAVGLDFVIVVCGILIAFQITHWSQKSQDKLIYQQARLAVIEEANTNLALAQEFTLEASVYQRSAKGAILDLENCSADAGAQQRLMNALQGMKFFLGVDVRKDATTLILSSDAFLDNLTPLDRATLSDYGRKLGRIAENVNKDYGFQLDKLTLSDIPIFTRTSRVDWGDGLMGFILNVSYSEACLDPRLSTYLFDRYQHASYELLQAQNLSKASRVLLADLGVSSQVQNNVDNIKLEQTP